MLSKKLFLIMIGVYQVCFAIGLEELLGYCVGGVGTVAVPCLVWSSIPNKNVDSFGGYVAFKKKYEDAKRPLPESMKDLNEMSCDRLIQCLDKENKSCENALEIINMLQLNDKDKITKAINFFCDKNKFCLLNVKKNAKKELDEEVLDILIEKCEIFCKNNEKLLAQCKLFGASTLSAFCIKYKQMMENSLIWLDLKVEINKEAEKKELKEAEEKELKEAEEKELKEAEEKQVLTVQKELLKRLDECCNDSIKNGTNILNLWSRLMPYFKQKKSEWLKEQTENSEKVKKIIDEMTLVDWVFYLEYKSFCQSNEKSDYWRNYMKRCLPPIVFSNGIFAILFYLTGLPKKDLWLLIAIYGVINFAITTMSAPLESVDELTSFQNGSRKLFFDMLKEEGKKMKKRGRERVS